MTILEVPAGVLSEKYGEPRLMIFGLLCAGTGYLGVAYSGGFVLLALCMLVAGVGAGFQHSLSSAIIVRAYENGGRRRAMGIYNSTGDAGKLTYTGLFGLAIGRRNVMECNRCPAGCHRGAGGICGLALAGYR